MVDRIFSNVHMFSYSSTKKNYFSRVKKFITHVKLYKNWKIIKTRNKFWKKLYVHSNILNAYILHNFMQIFHEKVNTFSKEISILYIMIAVCVQNKENRTTNVKNLQQLQYSIECGKRNKKKYWKKAYEDKKISLHPTNVS